MGREKQGDKGREMGGQKQIQRQRQRQILGKKRRKRQRKKKQNELKIQIWEEKKQYTMVETWGEKSNQTERNMGEK